MTEPRTGALKRALVEGVQADLEDLALGLEGWVEFAARLEEDTRGINGLASRCRGWRNQIQELAKAVREEQADVTEKLTGNVPEISQTVDNERMEEANVV